MTSEEFTKLLTPSVINRLTSSIYSRDKKDIIQTALARAWEKRDTFNGESDFYTWLYRLTIRVSLNHKDYHNKLCRKGEHCQFDDYMTTNDNGPHLELERSRSLDDLIGALDRMDRNSAKAWVMYHTQDVTYQDIAREIGGTVGSNKSRVSRANSIIGLSPTTIV